MQLALIGDLASKLGLSEEREGVDECRIKIFEHCSTFLSCWPPTHQLLWTNKVWSFKQHLTVGVEVFVWSYFFYVFMLLGVSVLLITFVLITWSLPPKGKSSGTSAASWWQAGPAGGQFREATEVESHTLSLVSHRVVSHTKWYGIQWYRILWMEYW